VTDDYYEIHVWNGEFWAFLDTKETLEEAEKRQDSYINRFSGNFYQIGTKTQIRKVCVISEKDCV